jgi:hypothetical protein
VHPHSSVPALAIGEREETLGTSNAPTNQLPVGTQFRRLVRSLSLRPSWLLASWADQTEPRLSLPKAFTSGLPALKSPRELPDMTTAPNGELRRQDFHLQVQQLVSLRSLHRVAWGRFPCFTGTMRSSDVSPSVPRPSLTLAARYLRWMLRFAPQAGASVTDPWPGPWSPVDPPGM